MYVCRCAAVFVLCTEETRRAAKSWDWEELIRAQKSWDRAETSWEELREGLRRRERGWEEEGRDVKEISTKNQEPEMSRGDVRWRKYQEIMVSATHTGLFNIPVFSLIGFNIQTSAPEFSGTRWMHIYIYINMSMSCVSIHMSYIYIHTIYTHT